MSKQRQKPEAANNTQTNIAAEYMPSVEEIQRELGTATSIDDFFGKEGILSRLFAQTLEQMLEAELTAKLGYEKYERKGEKSENSRNGHRKRTIRTTAGEAEIEVPRDRAGEYRPLLLEKHKARSNDIERKVLGLYAKGMTTRDIEESLAEMYGIEVSAGTISTITEKVMPLKYVIWDDRKEFMRDLKKVYQAATRDEAENNLLKLGEKWGDKYAVAIRSWENNWEALSTYFDYPGQIRRLIYTTNPIEGYNRQLRKVTKNKAAFPTARSVRKLLYLANERIIRKWTMPVPHWPLILNQLVIRFGERCPM